MQIAGGSYRTLAVLGVLVGGVTLAGVAPLAKSEPAPLAAVAASRVALDDPTIVAIFDAANTGAIESSGLAAKKSHNKDVVALAKVLVRDHEAVRAQGRDLTKERNVTPTPPKDFQLYKGHVAAMAKLKG